ncbi:MAG: hypothetical protein AABY22_34880 [Nanoarchaeota archaeon]
MKEVSKTICIDFDGVIHQYNRPSFRGLPPDPPVDGVKEALDKLQKLGFEIVIYSAREKNQKKFIKKWLKLYEIKYNKLILGKPKAVMYIDDRALRFMSWKDILNYF